MSYDMTARPWSIIASLLVLVAPVAAGQEREDSIEAARKMLEGMREAVHTRWVCAEISDPPPEAWELAETSEERAKTAVAREMALALASDEHLCPGMAVKGSLDVDSLRDGRTTFDFSAVIAYWERFHEQGASAQIWVRLYVNAMEVGQDQFDLAVIKQSTITHWVPRSDEPNQTLADPTIILWARNQRSGDLAEFARTSVRRIVEGQEFRR